MDLVNASSPSSTMSPKRSLPNLEQIRIAQGLGLLSNDDKGIDDVELFQRVYLRAKEQGLLEQLWDAVVSASVTENPFRQ